MSEYLMYQLWKQREERMPHELEHRRVVEERLHEQELQQELDAQLEVAEAPELADVLAGDEYVLVDE